MDDLTEKAREMLEGVTPGPWVAYGEPEVGLPTSLFSGEIGEFGFSLLEPLSGADLHFVAWSREGVPALLDALEKAQAKLARMEEALVDVDGPNIGAPTPEPGLMTILCRYYMLHTHQDDAADLAERYIAALQGEG